MGTESPPTRGSRTRLLAFGAIAAAGLVVTVVAVVIAGVNAGQQRQEAARAVSSDRERVLGLVTSGREFALFKAVDRYRPARTGRLAVAPITDGRVSGSMLAGPMCARVGWAGGHGLCLAPPDPAGFDALVLDQRLRTVKRIRLAGNPSRARVSPDGRYGAVTSFVIGHSYAREGAFSTRTTLIDMRAGKPIADLEKFTIMHDGKPVRAVDRNFWGVTFAADGDRFYATLATGGKTYLIRASLRKRRGETIHENVECPSLSPDGTRIGYKKRVVGGANAVWRFTVLDLETGRETPLAETHSIDDQLAWLDDDRLLYGEGDTTWSVAADGSGQPTVWLEGGISPQVAG